MNQSNISKSKPDYIAIVMFDDIDFDLYINHKYSADMMLNNYIKRYLKSISFEIIVKKINNIELHNVANMPVNITTSINPFTSAIVTPNKHTILYASGIEGIGEESYIGIFALPSMIAYLTNINCENPKQIGTTVISLADKFNNPVQILEANVSMASVINSTLARIDELKLSSGQPVYRTTAVTLMSTENVDDCAKALLSLCKTKSVQKSTQKRRPGRPKKANNVPLKTLSAKSNVTTRSMTKNKINWSAFGVKSIGCK